MGACASVFKARKGKADDGEAPLPEPARELPEEVKAKEEDKVESKNNESDKVVVVAVADDQSTIKVEEPENKDEPTTTAELEESSKTAPAVAAGEGAKSADVTISEVKEEK